MKESGNTLSQATKDRILRAVAVMQATVKTAKIQKLAQSTNLRDLSPDLLAWLGTTNFAQFRAWPRSYVVRRWFNAALHRAVVRVTTVGA